MATDISDRLQPALLDRLTDDGPQGDGTDFRVMSKAQLRHAVLRDLGVLLNTTQPSARTLPTRETDAAIAASVLNFGLPPLAGRLQHKIDIDALEAEIAQAIKRFEPRIRAESLVVRALRPTRVLETHNVIELRIQGELWSQPVPQEILLRTQLNLEAGQVEISDGAPAPTSRRV
ncbi:type VI secretion system baseplate subunit TssE [Paucibacter sp. R3-3]|uniref:Type VI secretion system baseplate subunit TssE n=1 Tax=Roseateles agri TaxID=3098619 RepID=A0ABU5DBU7_9BURK|nr:type VI secretion system baseplate subunit TssE [Paucibacter sp. R3-3]MDY0743281.1 type VI secretion system baseplate subunit TssE [Paucibacter sp. R3-3]